jgi:alpha-mannosidase
LKEKVIPVWDGELYLEAIRGVYTSQARNTRLNRQSERLYHDADLNDPLIARPVLANPRGTPPAAYAWAEVDTDHHVVLETVKKAEDENAWIVRVYEGKQYRSNRVKIIFGQPILKAVECNLLEEDETPVAYQGTQLIFAVKPFEIKTFKIWF